MITKILLPLIIISTLFMTECMADDNGTIKANINLVHIASANVKVSTLDNLEVILERTVDNNGNFFINPTEISKLSSDDYLYIYVDNIQVKQGDTPAYLKGIISIDSLSNNKSLNVNEITTYVADLFFENRAKIADNYQLLNGIIRNLGVYDINKDKRGENIDTFLYDSITTSSNLETILKLTYFYYLEQNNMTKVTEYIQRKSKELSLFSYRKKIKGKNVDITFENLDGKYISARYISTNQAQKYESNMTSETVSLKNGDALRYRLCLLEECSKEYTLYNDNTVIKSYIEDVSDPQIVKFGEKLAEYKKVQHLTPTRKKQKLLDIASVLLDISKSDNVKRYELYLISEDNAPLESDTTTPIIDIEGDYKLNDIEVTDANIMTPIKEAVNELENIKTAIDSSTDYDSLKQQLDDAMSKMDAVKQAIDNSSLSYDEKIALKDEADNIKREIDAIKVLIDGYKSDNDHSNTAIASIQSAIDKVIGMMLSDGSVNTSVIDLKAGRNTVSGTIDIRKLNDDIHSIWKVDNGNWYGYSPHADILKAIKEKYMLIKDTVANYKGVLVYAIRDTTIENIELNDAVNIVHKYARGYTLHGTDGDSLSVDDIVCEEPNKLIIVAKVRGDVPSVYVPDQTISGIDNFEYLYANDGYFVLCDKE